jgi:hypothetical protein
MYRMMIWGKLHEERDMNEDAESYKLASEDILIKYTAYYRINIR